MSRGKSSVGRLILMGVVAATFVVPSAAFAQGATGGDQTLNQNQSASGGNVNQVQQGAQQNCTVGGSGNCNQRIDQKASINSGGGGTTGVVRRTFVRRPVRRPVTRRFVRQRFVPHTHARRVQFVRSVPLARTGSDAWLVVLLGGVSLAGGLGMVAARRRGASSH